MRVVTKNTKEVWINIYNQWQSGVDVEIICQTYSTDSRNVSRICKVLSLCNGDADMACSIPYRVTQRKTEDILEYLNKGKPKIPPMPRPSQEFVPVTKDPSEKSFLGEVRVIPVNQNSKYTHKEDKNEHYNGVVKYYIPDYRREITPTELGITYEYGGIRFIINTRDNTIIFKNLHELLCDRDSKSIQYEPGEYDKNTIRDIIHIGEALVGIGMFFGSQV